MERYLAVNPTKEGLVYPRDILAAWQMIKPQYPTVARMAKDILAIPLHGVGIERVFNLGRDTCTYRRGHLHGDTIKKIMELKVAHQKEMVDERLSLDAELKKETMEDSAIMKEEEDRKVVISEEDKLAQSCHFDHFGKVPKRKGGLITFRNRRV